jgi:hypothetical protein
MAGKYNGLEYYYSYFPSLCIISRHSRPHQPVSIFRWRNRKSKPSCTLYITLTNLFVCTVSWSWLQFCTYTTSAEGVSHFTPMQQEEILDCTRIYCACLFSTLFMRDMYISHFIYDCPIQFFLSRREGSAPSKSDLWPQLIDLPA